jgi:hypothetical protein
LNTSGGWTNLAHDAMGRLTQATGYGLQSTQGHDAYGNNISS